MNKKKKLLSLITLLLILFVNNLLTMPVPILMAANNPNQQHTSTWDSFLATIRCVTCEGESLLTSNAPIAVDMRREIINRLEQGESKAQVRNYLTQVYGDYIFFKPAFARHTYFLWFAPLLFLLLGSVLLFTWYQKNPVRKRKT